MRMSRYLVAGAQPTGDREFPPIGHQAAIVAVEGLWINPLTLEVGSSWEMNPAPEAA